MWVSYGDENNERVEKPITSSKHTLISQTNIWDGLRSAFERGADPILTQRMFYIRVKFPRAESSVLETNIFVSLYNVFTPLMWTLK